MPSSRATMAAWQVRPPLSVMIAGSDLHDRLPIRTGGRRDQNLARLEGCEVARGRNAARTSRRDFFPYRPTGDDDGPVPFEIVGLVDIRRALRGHRLGPRLNDVELPVGAVLGPFDVHRHGGAGMLRIMGFDPHRKVGKAQHLRIGNAEFPPLGIGHVPGERRMATAALAVNHAYLLAAEPAPQHAAKSLAQRRLVNVELVRIDLTLDDGFAEAVTAGDEDHVAKSGFGIEREDDAAGADIRANHFHHGDGESDLEVIEAVVDAVGDRAIGENGGKAASAGFKQILRAAHNEESFHAAPQNSRSADPLPSRNFARRQRRRPRPPVQAADTLPRSVRGEAPYPSPCR